jgi:hypothetical protein
MSPARIIHFSIQYVGKMGYKACPHHIPDKIAEAREEGRMGERRVFCEVECVLCSRSFILGKLKAWFER